MHLNQSLLFHHSVQQLRGAHLGVSESKALQLGAESQSCGDLTKQIGLTCDDIRRLPDSQ